jgi:hypothetical protein
MSSIILLSIIKLWPGSWTRKSRQTRRAPIPQGPIFLKRIIICLLHLVLRKRCNKKVKYRNTPGTKVKRKTKKYFAKKVGSLVSKVK